MTGPTDEDRATARRVLWEALDAAEVTTARTVRGRIDALADANTAAVAQALADERERTLASCRGLHPKLTALASGPGVVTCDGHELRWTAR